jgi:copper(I)-binding protein
MNKTSIPLSIIATVLFALLLTACSSGPEEATIVIEDPWARPGQMKMAGEGEGMDMGSEGGDMAMAGTSAIFMTIRNDGREDDRLVGVSGDAAEFVEIHTTETRDGVTMMAQIPGIDIPGGDAVVLERGGLHIMLINLNQDLNEGDSVTVELQFEKSGSQTITAEVRAP